MPLTDEQALAFIREGQKRGLPKEQIRAILEREGMGMSVNVSESPMQSAAIAQEPVEPGKPWTEKQTNRLIRGGTTFAGSLLGGLVTGGLGGEVVGAGLGREAGNYLTGESPGEKVIDTMVGAGIGGVGGRIVSRAAGAVAGIPRALTQNVEEVSRVNPVRGAGMTLRGSPEPTAELNLGQKIQKALSEVSNTLTAGRAEKQAMLKAADAAKIKVDMTPVVDALRAQKIDTPTEPSAIAFNKQLEKFATNLWKRGRASKGLTPSQFDRFMIDELDEKVFTQSGDVASSRMGQALGEARKKAQEHFIGTMERHGFIGIRDANMRAAEELAFRSEADKVFGPGKLSLENRIRNLFKPGHEAEQQILERIGKSVGVDLLGQARDLATRRAYSSDPRVAEETFGLLRQMLFAPIGRGVAKVTSPARPFGAPVAGAATETFEERMRRSP